MIERLLSGVNNGALSIRPSITNFKTVQNESSHNTYRDELQYTVGNINNTINPPILLGIHLQYYLIDTRTQQEAISTTF